VRADGETSTFLEPRQSPLAPDVRVPGIIRKQRPPVPSLAHIKRLPRERQTDRQTDREKEREREREREKERERINEKRNSWGKKSSSLFHHLRKGCRIRGE
jgi:hypothetical protein